MSNTIHLASPVYPGGVVKCFVHLTPLPRLISQSDTNFDRAYYSCNVECGPDGEQCRFFKWEDELINGIPPPLYPLIPSSQSPPSTPTLKRAVSPEEDTPRKQASRARLEAMIQAQASASSGSQGSSTPTPGQHSRWDNAHSDPSLRSPSPRAGSARLTQDARPTPDPTPRKDTPRNSQHNSPSSKGSQVRLAAITQALQVKNSSAQLDSLPSQNQSKDSAPGDAGYSTSQRTPPPSQKGSQARLAAIMQASQDKSWTPAQNQRNREPEETGSNTFQESPHHAQLPHPISTQESKPGDRPSEERRPSTPPSMERTERPWPPRTPPSRLRAPSGLGVDMDVDVVGNAFNQGNGIPTRNAPDTTALDGTCVRNALGAMHRIHDGPHSASKSQSERRVQFGSDHPIASASFAPRGGTSIPVTVAAGVPQGDAATAFAEQSPYTDAISVEDYNYIKLLERRLKAAEKSNDAKATRIQCMQEDLDKLRVRNSELEQSRRTPT